jgi:hypothetical protein
MLQTEDKDEEITHAYSNTVRSESRCAFRLRYVDLVVSIAIAQLGARERYRGCNSA